MASQEKEIIQAARRGDEERFNDLVKKYQEKAFFIAFGVVNNEADARDIVQECLIKVYDKISEFRGDSAFSTWFYRIVVNLSIDFKRKRKYLSNASVEDTMRTYPNPVPKLNPEKRVLDNEILKNIEKALDQLSHQQRTAFVLRYYYSLEIRDISDILKCTESTVRGHIFRALKKLKSKLHYMA